MTYVGKYNLLLVGGSPHSSEGGVACSVSGWRLIDAPPYWAPRLGQLIRQVNTSYTSILSLLFSLSSKNNKWLTQGFHSSNVLFLKCLQNVFLFILFIVSFHIPSSGSYHKLILCVLVYSEHLTIPCQVV